MDKKLSLSPEVLLVGYSQGYFPMVDDEDGTLYWYNPDPRAIIPLDEHFHVPKRLARTIRRGKFEVRVDTAFRQVMAACAAPDIGRERTWINDEMIAAYTELHRLGFAHSVECWVEGELVGGLYGVALRGLFAGESMFSRMRDASKVALVHLVARLRAGGFVLLDTQFITPHLAKFGAVEIPKDIYLQELSFAMTVESHF